MGLKKLAKMATGAALGMFAGGGAGALGALGSMWSASQNEKLSDKQMDFQERMRDTQYQAAVKDMRAAGLNPMLAYSQGGNASPSGSMAHVDNPIDSASSAGGSWSSQALARAQVEQVRAATDNVKAQTAQTQVQTQIASAAVPYSAYSAEMSARSIGAAYKKLANDVAIQIKDMDIKDLTTEQMRKLQPLVREFQALQNATQKAGLPERKATADFYDTVPYAKWIELVKQLIPSGYSH